MTNEEIEKQLQELADMIAAALEIDPGAVSFHVFDNQEDVIEFIQKIGSEGLPDLCPLWDMDDTYNPPVLCNLCHISPPTLSSVYGYCGDCMAMMN